MSRWFYRTPNLLFFATIALLFILSAAFTPAEAEIKKEIVIGGNKDYPPYEFLDDDGNPVGYNVDLSRAIADVMGMKVSFRLEPWVNVRKAIDTGEVDALQGISYSEGRAKVIDFSIPHTVVNHSIFARKGTPSVKSLEELKGKSVAFHKSGFIYDYIAEKGIKMHVIPTGTQAEALHLVASGQVDYAVVASLPAAYIIKKLNLTDVVPIAKSVISVKYCYGVKKGNAELLAKINEGLAILKQTGQYQAIYDKWLGVLEPKGVSWGKIIRYGAIVSSLFLLTLIGSLLWSRILKKQVAIRTAALEQEVHERKRAAEELRLRQQQLVQADKMASLGILVSGVAHEINNPNALILLNAPLIMDYLKDIEPVVEAHYQEHGDFEVAGLAYSRLRAKVPAKLTEIQEGAKKIKRIVDDLKDFARRDESEPSCLMDINLTAQAAVRLIEGTIQKSTSNFGQNYVENPPKVKGNAQRIEQVIVNLLLNACQALRNSEEGILLSTQYDSAKGDIVLEVRDGGAGISPDNLPHLTDPFFTTKREMGGTGLGLSVSAGIIKEHRGTLEFASTPGQGTIVTLRLPAVLEGEKE